MAMKSALKLVYFDNKYRGMDLDARFDAARDRIRTLEYDWQMYRVLVQLLMELDDSHTRIYLPRRNDHFDYGFSMQTFNKVCLVSAVKKGSDAEKKGLSVGDRILKVGQIEPTRNNLWQIYYVLYRLDPTDKVGLTVQKSDGTSQTLTIVASTMAEKEYRELRAKRKVREKQEPFKCNELSAEAIACKLYSFSVEKNEIDKMFKIIAGHAKLILDLRGNGGGYVDTEEYLTSYFFERPVKMADVISRKKSETRITKIREGKLFKGDLAILIDSDSASASEVFSRVIQIEKRGTILGDISSGSVMTSTQIPLIDTDSLGFELSPYPLWMSVTVADVVMSDGNRLEHNGVVPDVPIVPTSSALFNGRDPILATAANQFGVSLTSEQAGKLNFLVEKVIEDDDLPDEKATRP